MVALQRLIDRPLLIHAVIFGTLPFRLPFVDMLGNLRLDLLSPIVVTANSIKLALL